MSTLRKLHVSKALILFATLFSITLYHIIIKDETIMRLGFIGVMCVCVLSFFLQKEKRIPLILIYLLIGIVVETLFLSLYNPAKGFAQKLVDILNSLTLGSYFALCYLILKLINKKHLKKIKRSVIIILTLGIIASFFVIQNISYNHFELSRFIIELLFRICVMFLLCISIIYFLIDNSQKATVLFLMCLAFVLSELLQITYFVLVENHLITSENGELLNLFYAMYLLRLLGLCFCFVAIQLKPSRVNNYLEATS